MTTTKTIMFNSPMGGMPARPYLPYPFADDADERETTSELQCSNDGPVSTKKQLVH